METVSPLLIRLSPRSGLRGRSYDLAEDDLYPLKTNINISRIDYLHLPYIYPQSVIQYPRLGPIEKLYKNIVQCLNPILFIYLLPLPPFSGE
jgi:hypothetical protein